MSATPDPAQALHDRPVALVLGTSEGGVGAHVRVVAERLMRAGAHAHVCGPEATERLFVFTGTGAVFDPVGIENGVRPLADRRAVATLVALVRDAHLVHAHGLRAGFVAARAVPLHIPLLVTWHNAVLGSAARRRALAAIERRVARRATINLAVSGDLVARITELGGKAQLAPVGALPPSAANRDPADVRAELGADVRPLVVAVGRLHSQKGFDTLVDAAALLAGRRLKPLVVIAGEGPDRQALLDRIAATDAPVRLLGRRDDVPDLLRAADVVAMPSRWEGSPIAAHEAMFAGRAIVASAVGGLPDMAADGALALVPPGDATALAGEIARLLDDPEAAGALGARAARRAAQWPDAIASADAVLDVYASLLGDR